MKVDPLQAARLFLIARGRGDINAEEDLVALATLLQEFATAGHNAALIKIQGLKNLIIAYGNSVRNEREFREGTNSQFEAQTKSEQLFNQIMGVIDVP